MEMHQTKFENDLFANELISEFDYLCLIQKSKIIPQMRETLLVWIFDIFDRLPFQHRAKQLSVVYIDKYLAICEISTDNLQLLGMVALNLALKVVQDSFELKTHFNINDMVYLCAETYSKEEFKEMELKLVKVLHWKFFYRTPNDWVDILIVIFKLTLDEKTLSQIKVLLDFCQINYFFSKYPFSMLALACLKFILRKQQLKIENLDEMNIFSKIQKEKVLAEKCENELNLFLKPIFEDEHFLSL